MRLVQVKPDGTFSLVKREGTSIPPYAILSHTWGKDEDEVTYDDMRDQTGQEKAGYAKMSFCAKQVAKDGLQHFWIDTCCIDKSSSAELSEAITSMFRWYKNSVQCYVYLADVVFNKRKADEQADHPTWLLAFRTSKWFTRGWTLQELLAPHTVSFFSREGKKLGTKSDLEQHINEVTHIPVSALRGVRLHDFSVPDRMSWAASRETKREEDEAYSLLGIFGVSMVPIYGEEKEAAFRRLRREIRETVGNDTISLEEEEKRLLMRTLQFDQIDARHTTIKNAHAKTCKWLLRKSEYVEWLDTTKLLHHHGFLWVKGKPGTGKSTLMKFAFGKTSKTMGKPSVVVAFFFNARGEVLEKSVIGMYRSLLLQLLEQVPGLQHSFKFSSLSPSSVNAEYQWTVDSLQAQLEQAILDLGNTPVVCFIDALDECDQRQVRSMVSFFESISELAVSSSKSFRVCFSSRHYPEITIKKGLSFELEGQEGHTQDINNYLESELEIGHSKIANEVREDLQRKASGVFMWVVLVVDILQKEYDRGRMYALKQRLREIPDGLHELFHDILTRDSRDKQGLILSIQWVLFAKQPLSPEQLYFAILSGVEPELVSQWDFGAAYEEDTVRRFILDASKGLTEITKSKSQKVQFIHESVRDFLLKDNGLGKIWPDLRENFEGQSHERLKQCCFTTMCTNVEDHIGIPSEFVTTLPQEITDSRAAVTSAFPILEYAVENILHHANSAEGFGIDQTDFMTSFPLDRWIRLGNLFEKHKIRRHTNSMSILYILGERNMPNLIRSHASVNTCFEVEAERYGTPYLAAVATRSKEAVCAFVDVLNRTHGQKNLTPESYARFYQSKDGQSFLSRNFTFSKQRNVIDHLFDFRDEAALCLAITANVVDVNAKLFSGSTPLIWATQNRRKNIVELLLSTDKVDVDASDDISWTPLMWAAQEGHKYIVELLLSTNKVDVDARNDTSWTPLMWAAENGHKDIVELLLSTDKADVDARSNTSRTPLMLAAQAGHKDVAELLLSTEKVDINAKDNSSRTPLLWAALRGHKDIVELLLSTDELDVNAKDDTNCTALMWAAQMGHKDIVEMLLVLEKQTLIQEMGRD
jgi:ankyrin repeat protein